ncbi:MAG: acetyl-CoA carboxylase biotin carboxyl carrier protein subunit [Halioglobus sp.]
MAIIDMVSEFAGTVWKVEASVGQTLAEDDTVIIVESMKMEIPVGAPRAGVLLEVLVGESDILSEGTVVARLECP